MIIGNYSMLHYSFYKDNFGLFYLYSNKIPKNVIMFVCDK